MVWLLIAMKSTFNYILFLGLILIGGPVFAQLAPQVPNTKVISDSSPDTTYLELYTCPGYPLSYEGKRIKSGQSAYTTLSTQDGRDSVVKVEVKTYPEVLYELETEQTCWNKDAGSINITQVYGGLGPYTFSLDGQRFQQSPQFDFLSGGAYQIYVRDAYQCVHPSAVEVPMKAPIEIRAEDRVLACHSDSLVLRPEVMSGRSADLRYRWSDGSRDSMLIIQEAGIYWVEVSNECETVREEIWVGLGEQDGQKKSYIYMPNAFSPNADGYNDRYRGYPASGVQVLNYEMHIYDRRGNQLFETYDITGGWDGSYKGQIADPEAYLFYMKAVVVYCQREIEVFEDGNVTLLRNGTR